MTRVELANGMCGSSRWVPCFSRPLRETGKFADIKRTEKKRNREGHDFSRAAKQHQRPQYVRVKSKPLDYPLDNCHALSSNGTR